jgi:uncharacterized protein YrrD
MKTAKKMSQIYDYIFSLQNIFMFFLMIRQKAVFLLGNAQ